ncbi:MAG: phosphotransferase [Spirochaetota bacterium]
MYRRLSQSERAFEYKHLEQIASVFPQLTITSKSFYTDGFANDVITINDSTVFRFPKYQWALDDMFGEYTCLELAGMHTSMRLPKWTIHNDAFISYQKIPGLAMHQWHLFKEDPETVMQAAQDLGAFLHQMHHIPAKELNAAGIQTSVSAHSYTDWLKLYDDIQQELYPSMPTASQDWVDTLFRTIIADNTVMDYQPKFIIGELGSSHILFDYKKKNITGVVDFRSAGRGDPAFDFAYLYWQFGERFVELVQSVYECSERMRTRAKFIAETLPLQWALGGNRLNSPYWFMMNLGTKTPYRSVYEKDAFHR